MTSEIRHMAGRPSDPRLSELSRNGLDRVKLSILGANSAFDQLVIVVTTMSEFYALVESGSYLKVLEEATRQNVRNLADLNTYKIVSPDIRAATEQVQQALRVAPDGGGLAGPPDPALLEVLRSEALQQFSRSGFFEPLAIGPSFGAPVD